MTAETASTPDDTRRSNEVSISAPNGEYLLVPSLGKLLHLPEFEDAAQDIEEPASNGGDDNLPHAS